MARYGMTIPFAGVPLSEPKSWYGELADLGYTDLWSSEANGTDAFTPLPLASAWVPQMRLGCAIVPAYTRGPALLVQSVAAMAEAAPGRFAFGFGTSANVVVQNWNRIPLDEPYKKTRDVVRFLRQALAGEKVDGEFDTFTVKGFRLGRVPKVQPQILIAALRPGMLRLAGRESDGAIINWLSAEDVAKVVPEVQAGAGGGPAATGKEIAARLFVAPHEGAATRRPMARLPIAPPPHLPGDAAPPEGL